MPERTQIILWKRIGYAAQDVILLCDCNNQSTKINEAAETIKQNFNSLDIAEIERLNTEKGIAFIEYVNMLFQNIGTGTIVVSNVRNIACAILKMVVDMNYGSLKQDEVYKKIAIEGEDYV